MRIQTFISTGLLLWAAAATTHAAAYSNMFVFGDSLSDNGDAFIALTALNNPNFPATTPRPYTNLVPSAPYDGHTFSNAGVWVNFLDIPLLGKSVTPSFAGGTNFAFGGARTGDLTGVQPDFIPSLQTQANTFVGSLGANSADPNALYVVWGGGNDVRSAAEVFASTFANTAGNFNAANAAASAVIADGFGNIGEIITTLANKGAKHFLVPNIPNVGLAPASAALGLQTQQLVSGLATSFDLGLAQLLPALQASLNIDIITVDIFTLISNTITQNPTGLNVTDPCIFANNGQGCSNPDQFLFWDGLHPTSQRQQEIASVFQAAVVPVPAAFPLLLSALLVIRARRRTIR